MILAETALADACSSLADIEQIATDIGELEALTADPLLAEQAGSLRNLVGQLRVTMDVQFDMIAAGSAVFPWWRNRMHFRKP